MVMRVYLTTVRTKVATTNQQYFLKPIIFIHPNCFLKMNHPIRVLVLGPTGSNKREILRILQQQEEFNFRSVSRNADFPEHFQFVSRPWKTEYVINLHLQFSEDIPFHFFVVDIQKPKLDNLESLFEDIWSDHLKSSFTHIITCFNMVDLWKKNPSMWLWKSRGSLTESAKSVVPFYNLSVDLLKKMNRLYTHSDAICRVSLVISGLENVSPDQDDIFEARGAICEILEGNVPEPLVILLKAKSQRLLSIFPSCDHDISFDMTETSLQDYLSLLKKFHVCNRV
jgi:hypothetical protein